MNYDHEVIDKTAEAPRQLRLLDKDTGEQLDVIIISDDAIAAEWFEIVKQIHQSEPERPA